MEFLTLNSITIIELMFLQKLSKTENLQTQWKIKFT